MSVRNTKRKELRMRVELVCSNKMRLFLSGQLLRLRLKSFQLPNTIR